MIDINQRNNFIFNLYHKDFILKDIQVYIKYLLAYYCMPTLLMLKPSNLIHVNKRYLEGITDFFIVLNKEIQPFESHASLIYQNNEMLIILIFNKELLNEQINRMESKSYLKEYGYEIHDDDVEIETVLHRLAKRYTEYKEKKDYPHEIGVILGYPLQDVIDFIQLGGKDYIYCGYWKVYHDVDTAFRIFENYSRAREEAISCIITGRGLPEIIPAWKKS